MGVAGSGPQGYVEEDPDRTDALPVLTEVAGAGDFPEAQSTAVLEEQTDSAELRRLEATVAHLHEELAFARARIASLEAAVQAAQTATTDLADWRLVRLDLREERTYPLGRRSRIGRADTCEVCIDSPSISRYHAIVLIDAEGALIEDLRSTNGILLNGRKIERHRLHDGDLLTLGEIKFRISNPPPPKR
ncbi:MAG: FHA domain-containing protein [Gammaproteobacteria bacterium]|nr:FHA domain-containing protein [Gammaproteobacteria bacterium]